VLTIYQNVYGSDVPEMVGTLLYLADLFENSMNYRGFSSFEQIQTDEKHAEQHYQRALIIRERAYGPDHPDVAKNLKQLAKTCYLQGKFAQAKPLFERALLILEKVYGSEAPEMATTLTEIAESYMTQRHFQGDTEAGHYFACIEKAEEYLKQALLIREKILGADHPDTFATFDKLWGFYVNAG
jgi:tetratricopeptide (TPR) repeat protein